jgi:hypothetical protein
MDAMAEGQEAEHVLVQYVSWAPQTDHGQGLVWVGQPVGTWLDQSALPAGEAVLGGRIFEGVSALGEIPELLIDDPDPLLAISDTGFGAVGRERVRVHDSLDGDWRRRFDLPGVPVAVSYHAATLWDLRVVGGEYHLYTHDALRDTEQVLPGALPTGRLKVAGWLPDHRMVAVVDGRLFLVGAGQASSLTEVGSVIGGDASRLTIATDLMTDEQPTVHRAAPDWPTSPSTPTLWIVVGAAAAALLFGAGIVVARRRRSGD